MPPREQQSTASGALPSSTVQPRRLWARAGLAAWACATFAVVAHQGWAVMRSDWTSGIARQRIAGWAAGDTWDEGQWERALQDLKRSVELTPDDATLQDTLVQLYELKGDSVWTTGEPGTPEMAQYEQAHAHAVKALALRPLHAPGWASLAWIHYALNSPADDTFAAWDRALALGPYEPEVQRTLLLVADIAWNAAPEHVRSWAEKKKPGITEAKAREALRQADLQSAPGK
jgi:tetratricopeptide (TPR) repeat protein